MTPQQFAALERRVADLERRLPRGVGISTAFGATEVRTIQSGFPVELTGTFDSVTGYPWKRRVLDAENSEVVNVTGQTTGEYAFTPDNDETLTSGAQGWLEPSPEAQGWILLMPGDGGGSMLLCEVTVSSNNSHTVKQKTFSGGSIVDVAGPVTYTQCRSTTATALPVGTYVSMDPVADSAGDYWITPVGYASLTLPGLVSETSQTFNGDKTFDDHVIANDSESTGVGFLVMDAYADESTLKEAFRVWSDTAYSDMTDRTIECWGGAPTAVTEGYDNPGLFNVNGVIRVGYFDQSLVPLDTLYYCTDYNNANTSLSVTDVLAWQDDGDVPRRLYSELSTEALYFYVASDGAGTGAAWVQLPIEDGHLVAVPPV